MQDGKFRTCDRFLDCRVHLLHRHRRTRQVHRKVHHQVQLRSEVTSSHQETGRGKDSHDLLRDLHRKSRRYRMPASAQSSQDSASERPAKVAFRKHRIFSRIKMTRAPCRRRTGEAQPRAEKFGDLITADHKILSEGSELQNNHRYAVVVQDLATQWIRSYPCKSKTSQVTEKSLRKFLEPSVKSKKFYRQFIGCWQILGRSIMESPNFNTSSIRDKQHGGQRRKTRERRYFSSTAAFRIG